MRGRFVSRMRPTAMPVALTIALLPLAAAAQTPAPASGPARPLAASIPADAKLAWFARPAPWMQPHIAAAAQLTAAAGMLGDLGLFEGGAAGSALTDVALALPVLGRHEHALVMLDAGARRIGRNSFRVDDLQVALLVRTGGDNAAIRQRIAQTIARHTHAGLATLKWQEHAGVRFQRLVDKRLPAYAVWSWCELDDLYVVTLGRGALEAVLDTHAGRRATLADDAWFAGASRRCRRSTSMLAILANFQALRDRLNPLIAGRPNEVIAALGAAEFQRGLWTLGLDGRDLTCLALLGRPNGDEFLRISDPSNLPPRHRGAIPDGATAVAVMRLPIARMARQIAEAFLASRRPRSAAAYRRVVEDIERQIGAGLATDVLANLGPTVIIHNHPRPVLPVPILCTVIVELRRPERVRLGLDGVLTWWQQRLGPKPATQPEGMTGYLQPRLLQTDDGIWYIQAGLVGPAMAVTDHYLVMSWSPPAVRENIAWLQAHPPRPDPPSAE